MARRACIPRAIPAAPRTLLDQTGADPADSETGLSAEQAEIVDRAAGKLASLSGNELSERTHSEKPWIDARGGLALHESCSNIITKQSIADYYSRHPIV
ncbi:Panacea domain-containing protein [Trueperella bialowiezensis]|uniref:Panacea domain-containing protein n=1 Tax=Trueperella bialowiezensis TaxID=312285 RepID=UPI0024118D60|nr:type II toxin-antitoxin system antitoxin SocA domain-containing protein [Trueperella bialowiezensis]